MLLLMGFINIITALILAPFLLGVINRTKAKFAGRQGRPLLQAYYDMARLLGKGAVYSRTTTWLFRAGPVVGLAATMLSLTLLPFGGVAPLFVFGGDFILFVYLLGVARFFTVLAALDTGSAFEGMGASREATYSALAEPVLFIGLLSFTRMGQASLSAVFSLSKGTEMLPAISLTVAALFLIALSENSRIPVDDPNTHLELTMIHEVMVLDHSGPDLAFILYGASLKLWVFGALIVNLLVSFITSDQLVVFGMSIIGMFIFGVAIGVAESTMARIKLVRVPQYMAVAAALAVSALIL